MPGCRSPSTAPIVKSTNPSACPAPGARTLESFAVAAARLAAQPPVHFKRAWIDYHGPAGTFPSYRFTDVLRGADRDRLEHKIVVVGTSARKQNDIHPTPHTGGRVMSGAEIQ